MAGIIEGTPCSVRPKMIIVSESKKRQIANLKEVTDAICPEAMSTLGYTGGCSLEHPSRLPLKAQLQLFSRTTLYLGVCGGASIFSIFMPTGSSAILYCPRNDNRLDWGLMQHSHVQTTYRSGEPVRLPSGRMGIRVPVHKLKQMLVQSVSSAKEVCDQPK